MNSFRDPRRNIEDRDVKITGEMLAPAFTLLMARILSIDSSKLYPARAGFFHGKTTLHSLGSIVSKLIRQLSAGPTYDFRVLQVEYS